MHADQKQYALWISDTGNIQTIPITLNERLFKQKPWIKFSSARFYSFFNVNVSYNHDTYKITLSSLC